MAVSLWRPSLPGIRRARRRLSDPVAVDTADAQPGVMHVNGNAFAVGYPADGSAAFQVSDAAPAKAGDVLLMYCLGLGTTNPAIADGSISPAQPLAMTPGVTVSIGGRNAAIQFAGLVPNYVGLYQINAVMPDGVAPGPAVLTVTAGGQTSPIVHLAAR